MAETSKVNIKSLPVTTEVKVGDYLILETEEGTRLLDYDNFVVTEYNTTFHPSLSTNTADILTNTTNVAALSTALSGTNTTLRIGATAVSVSALGIGTHAPEQELHIKSTTSASALIESSGTSGSIIQFKNPLKTWSLTQSSGILANFAVYEDGVNRLTFAVGGDIGIGTYWPTSLLHVSGGDAKISSSTTTGSPTLKLANGTNEYHLKIDGSDSNSLKLFDSTNNSSRLTIDATGNVSVGNVAPATTLHVGSISACMTLDANTGTPPNPDASSQGRIYMKGGNLVIQYNDAGTIRYKYLNLVSTGVTWVHSTTAP